MSSFLLEDPSKHAVGVLLLIWLGLLGVLLAAQWRSRSAAGLPLAYVLGLTLIHFFGAWIYWLPHYTPRSEILLQNNYSLLNTFLGFRAATLGLAGFVAGALLCPLLMRRQPPVFLQARQPQVTTQLPGTLLLISVLSFFIIAPILRRIPSLGSLANSGTSISVVAVFLFCWAAYASRRHFRLMLWIMGTFAFPLVTIVFMGFASFGAMAAVTVWTMLLRAYRPRWIGLPVMLVLLAGAMTLYVNWMSERDNIRDAVWGGRSFSSRIERFVGMFTHFEFFDVRKQVHLELVDLRLNQNDLVGKAIVNLERGRVPYAEGGTLWVAMVSWVPRIIWPNKPVTAGGGNMVAYYTGQKFAESTSVGAGQILEFFANFGYFGVFTGMMALGGALGFLDRRAGFYLAHGDLWSAARWILPGIGMLQAGGMLAEIVGSTAANLIFVLLLHHQIFARYYGGGQVMGRWARG